MEGQEDSKGGWHDTARHVEPVLIIVILILAMYLTRRKDFSLFHRPKQDSHRSLLSPDSSRRSSNDSERSSSPAYGRDYPPKMRRIFGRWTVHTPNSSRFNRNFHSRILKKFPFLLEMFYWVIAMVLYRLTIYLTSTRYGSHQGLWDTAQAHGVSILEFESKVFGRSNNAGTDRWLEWRVQQWFLAGVDAGDWRGGMLTVLNRVYALIHIPGTAAFIAYYYATAPTHRRFCTARRTISLSNFVAFFVFTLYPCMPPRLLPPEYGFFDTVDAENAASVWMKGDYVNALAAMPSMHFGYAFAVGCVFVYESGFLRRLQLPSTLDGDEVDSIDLVKEEGADKPRSAASRITLLCFGIFYPSLILLAIVATANHYLLDAFAAVFVVLFAFITNKVLLNFLVLEDWLLWALRLEKPEPTTGMNQDVRRKR